MAAPRVIVLGLGAMGSAAARVLAERGADVLGLEQHTPVHDRGSSHGDSRIVRRAYFEHPDYVPFLDRAYRGWAELEQRAATSLLTRTGALMIGSASSPVVTGTLASAQRWGLPHEVLDRAVMQDRYPQLQLPDDGVAVLERDAGYVRPEQVVATQLDLARAAGAELRFGARVQGWRLHRSGVEVTLDGDRLTADRLVVTTGAWTGGVLADAALPLRPVRTVAYRFEPLDPTPFAPDRFPVFVYDLGGGERDDGEDAIYGVGDLGIDTPTGRRHAAKIGFHHRLRDTDPDQVDRRVTVEEVSAMREVLRARIPGLAGDCLATVTCLYTMTPDEHFVLGHLPGADGRVSLFAGCSGHAFKFTPAIGAVLADLTLDGATTAPIALFDPARF